MLKLFSLTIPRLAARTVALMAATFFASAAAAVHADEGSMSLNSEIMVVPAPGGVTIDGRDDDWDLSAGVWSYNSPVVASKFSVWTHLMWDAKGVYFLARYHDPSPLQNGARGRDFQQSWRADAYQARVIFDDKKPDEHQLHINLFYSTPDQTPYMIAKHGGFKPKPPYDETGPDRPDLLEKFGSDMLAAGGKLTARAWDDGKGYNLEAFWPWSSLRVSGTPLPPGESFVFGLEAMWGNGDGTSLIHRLADGIKDDKVNRIFMFRARNGWGRAVMSEKGKLAIADAQRELHAERLKRFVNYETAGTIEIPYELDEPREVTIAIDDAKGVRVRNLFGQYPRKAGPLKDLWDGLDDKGNPVAAGTYYATVVDHKPIELKFLNSLYNAATPPWVTESGAKLWGANHGHPTSAATRGDVTILTFTGTEGASGIVRVNADGKILWTDGNEFLDATIDDMYAYGLSRSSWQKKTLLMRYRLTDGQIVPFDDANKSPDITLLPGEEGVADTSTVAYAGGKLFVFIPDHPVFRLDPKTGAIEAKLDAPGLAALADRNEQLYGLMSSGDVVLLDLELKPQRTLFAASGVKRPMRLGIRQDTQQFAISNAETNQIHVFDASGKSVRTIGTAYADEERPAGKFVSTDLIKPMGVDFDAQGRLWVAEASKYSKRVTCWSDGGTLIDQYWGQADYGAMGGFAITNDSTRFIAHAVEFKLDPKPDVFRRKTNEQPLIYHPQLKDERGFVYTINGTDYACGSPGYNKSPRLTIAKRGADGIFRPCVRIDLASTKTVNGKKELSGGRAWVDLNDDGKESGDEVTPNVNAARMYWSNGWVRPDLTILTTNALVFPCKGFTKQGVPLYDFANPVRPTNTIDTTDRPTAGSTPIMDLAGNISNGIEYHTADGRRGSYPNRYRRHDAPAAQRGVLIAPFRTNGVIENVPGVGSVTAIGGDRGEWFLISMDGLYISSILQDIKGEVTQDETYVGPESFGGFIWRDEQNRVLAQLGGPSYRIMEVLGLETVRKRKVPLTVTAEQIKAGQTIAAAANKADAEPSSLTIARVASLPREPAATSLPANEPLIVGATDVRVQERGNATRWWRAALAHDGKSLAISFQVADPSPWKNGSNQFTHAFIGGDCVDVKLDIPGRGAVRLLTAPVGAQGTVVYSQSKSDKPDNPVTYSVGNNMANATKMDVVRRVANAAVTHRSDQAVYTVLVTLPLAEIGLDPATANEIKGVVGVIYSDPSGTNRAVRLYWADKQTDMVSDVPTEARLDASRWGKIVIQK